MKKNYNVVPYENSWAVKQDGAVKALQVTNSQKEAIDIGRELAEKGETELLIYGKDGKIREKNSYGNDPRHIKG